MSNFISFEKIGESLKLGPIEAILSDMINSRMGEVSYGRHVLEQATAHIPESAGNRIDTTPVTVINPAMNELEIDTSGISKGQSDLITSSIDNKDRVIKDNSGLRAAMLAVNDAYADMHPKFEVPAEIKGA